MLISILAIHGSWKLYYVFVYTPGMTKWKWYKYTTKDFWTIHENIFINAISSYIPLWYYYLLFFFYLHICPFIIIKVSKGEIGELCLNAGLTKESQK